MLVAVGLMKRIRFSVEASDYSELLLGTEENNYNLTQLVCWILIGAPACEALQLNVCFAAIQRIQGIAPALIRHVFDVSY